jgi:four helix bundle protein
MSLKVASKSAKRYLQLNDIDAYTIVFHLSNYVWDIVKTWDYFSKKTIGAQFVESIDSISANVAEGFWRYTKKDKIKFYRYSQGSTGESLDWNEKAKRRKLLTEDQYKHIHKELKRLPRELNSLIGFTNEKLST